MVKLINKVYVIAEAGINHNGDLFTALKMIKLAKKIGANCIKFQAFDVEKLVSKDAKSANYQKKLTGKNKQKDFLKHLQLKRNDFKALYNECEKLKIDFLCTAFDKDYLKYLVSLGMKRIKIPSGEITNFPYLEFAAKLSLPIILSTGMSNMREVKEALNYMMSINSEVDVTLLHCTSLYPAPYKTLNLLAIKSLSKIFKMKLGYSDHSLGNIASIASIAMGARLIEKHFTIDKNLPGPDQKASCDEKEFSNLIKEIRILETALGKGVKSPHNLERNTASIARRSWHAKRDIKTHSILTAKDLILLRPGNEILGNKNIVGYKTKKYIKKGEIIKKQWIKDYNV